jgi:signal transduction histidine kinase
MMNEAVARGDDPLAAKVREQIDIMRDQVARHLERARLAARLTVVGSMTEVRPVVVSLARTMEKIHRDRDITIEVEAPPDARFQGEQQDLEEMLGNLVDNACKWAQTQVSIEVMRRLSESALHRETVHIIVDDDGPGLSPSQREQVSRRGQRLDETKPGSGLGLSIVSELARLYGGSITLGTAPLGGLRVELLLPAADRAVAPGPEPREVPDGPAEARSTAP